MFNRKKPTSTENTPVVQGFGVGSLFIDYSKDNHIYYSFYRENPFVRACIDEIRDTAGKFGIKGYTGEGDDMKEVDVSGFKELIAYETGDANMFIKTLIRDFLITGNAYVYRVNSDFGETLGFQILNPRYIKPIGDSYGDVLYYEQRVGATTVKLDPEQVHHLKDNPDPENVYVGISKMESLLMEVRTDKEARDSNYSFFFNNQTPSSIITVEKDTNIEKLKGLKEIFTSGKNKGGSNKHKTFVGEGVKDILRFQDKISDMQFVELRKFTLELVCSVYGVPKSVLNFTEGVNYTSSDLQYQQFIQETIMPLETIVSGFLTQIARLEDLDITIEFVQDHIDMFEKKSDVVSQLVTDGVITPDEGREILGLEAIGDEESQKLRINKPKETEKEKTTT